MKQCCVCRTLHARWKGKCGSPSQAQPAQLLTGHWQMFNIPSTDFLQAISPPSILRVTHQDAREVGLLICSHSIHPRTSWGPPLRTGTSETDTTWIKKCGEVARLFQMYPFRRSCPLICGCTAFSLVFFSSFLTSLDVPIVEYENHQRVLSVITLDNTVLALLD